MPSTHRQSCLSSWSLCSLWHHWPQYSHHSSLILVLDSYLSSRSFRVKCEYISLPLIPAYVVFLKKVLFLVLYSLSCIPPLSVPSFLLCHLTITFMHMTTQRFFSFYPAYIHSNITHLQNALKQISTCMTANLLNLNSSKTEFLFIGLNKLLVKIDSCPSASPTLQCSQSRFHLWWTFYLLWPNMTSFQILLFSHLWTYLHTSIHWF